jgi:hypothetical protein
MSAGTHHTSPIVHLAKGSRDMRKTNTILVDFNTTEQRFKSRTGHHTSQKQVVPASNRLEQKQIEMRHKSSVNEFEIDLLDFDEKIYSGITM